MPVCNMKSVTDPLLKYIKRVFNSVCAYKKIKIKIFRVGAAGIESPSGAQWP